MSEKRPQQKECRNEGTSKTACGKCGKTFRAVKVKPVMTQVEDLQPALFDVVRQSLLMLCNAHGLIIHNHLYKPSSMACKGKLL